MLATTRQTSKGEFVAEIWIIQWRSGVLKVKSIVYWNKITRMSTLERVAIRDERKKNKSRTEVVPHQKMLLNLECKVISVLIYFQNWKTTIVAFTFIFILLFNFYLYFIVGFTLNYFVCLTFDVWIYCVLDPFNCKEDVTTTTNIRHSNSLFSLVHCSDQS